ncbi:hypothetical protein QJS10_CPB17g02232 [Acorus calamus]|uniref:Transmembrane protein n=1 Tax=Acorus calamus TaxID=4465 RepID=A0AAV9CUV3_ACOCL|nr:hypothetical protein QJS10_CPB17g02232 [Acorus calamus]
MAEKTLFASSSVLPLLSLVFLVFFIAGSSHIVNGDNLPEVEAARPGKLEVPLVHLLQNSPGSKPGQVMYGNRVRIRGLSRLRNLNKYSHLLKVKVAPLQPESRDDRRPPLMNVEVCLHRNASIEMGMCASSDWVKLVKGLWTRPVSPFSDRFLDIRMPGLSSKTVEVSVEEEFAFHRLVFLVLGMMMMMLARPLSVFVGFYYSSAMFAGVILVVLIVLFQGMKLPTV